MLGCPWWLIGAAVFLVLALIMSWHRKQQRATQQALEQSKQDLMRTEDNYNTIFVAIPCYRDEAECAATLFSLFNEADCPWRVTVGIVHHIEAHNDYTDNILNMYEQLCDRKRATSFQKQIRVLMAPATEAKGPLSARAIIEAELFKNERYYMTIDSHMRFVPNWDTRVLAMYDTCLALSDKPILTTFPADFNRDTQQTVDDRPTYVTMDGFDQDGFPRPMAMPFVSTPVRPLPAPFWVPCFSFASSRALHEVPLLDTLPYLFFPEMYFQSARYWTHGWDFYSPHETLVYHIADRSYRPTFWEQLKGKERLAARMRSLHHLTEQLNQNDCSRCHRPATEHAMSGANHAFEPKLQIWFGHARSLPDYDAFVGLTHVGTPHVAIIPPTRAPTDIEQIAKYGRVM